jgi:phosphoribosylamine--glycine ligase
MKKEGHPYKGFLYVGIMVVDGEPYVIEYNARLGDPEAQVIIPMIQGNLFPIIKHVINDSLDSINIENNDGFAVTVILVSKGYPDEYKKGMKIQGLDDNLMIFHSGTKIMNDKYYTNGGRVLSVIGQGSSLRDAIDSVYKRRTLTQTQRTLPPLV